MVCLNPLLVNPYSHQTRFKLHLRYLLISWPTSWNVPCATSRITTPTEKSFGHPSRIRSISLFHTQMDGKVYNRPIVGCFDETTKLRFRNSNEPQYIKFGGAGDNDQNCNIRFGQLNLLGSDVAKFFEPSVKCIVKGVLGQCKVAHKPISVCPSGFLGCPSS